MKETISYLIFGGLTTAFNFLVYAVLQKTVALPLFVINVIAWVATVIFAFITNKLYVFESKSWKPDLVFREAALFLGARILSGIVEIGAFPILLAVGLNQPLFGIDGFLAKVILSVVIIILNYIFSKWFVFKKEKPCVDQESA